MIEKIIRALKEFLDPRLKKERFFWERGYEEIKEELMLELMYLYEKGKPLE